MSAAARTEFTSPEFGNAGVDAAYVQQIYNPYKRMAANYINKDIRDRIGDCPAYCYHTRTGTNKSCPKQCYSYGARRRRRHRYKARTHKRAAHTSKRKHALPAIMQQYAARRRRRRR